MKNLHSKVFCNVPRFRFGQFACFPNMRTSLVIVCIYLPSAVNLYSRMWNGEFVLNWGLIIKYVAATSKITWTEICGRKTKASSFRTAGNCFSKSLECLDAEKFFVDLHRWAWMFGRTEFELLKLYKSFSRFFSLNMIGGNLNFCDVKMLAHFWWDLTGFRWTVFVLCTK